MAEFWSTIINGSPNYGYFSGGHTNIGIYVTTTDRIVFSSGVTGANTVSNLSNARACLTSVSDGSTHGYFSGGITDGGVLVSTTDRIIFSTGAVSSNTVSNLSQARRYLSGISDGSSYGYFSGGSTSGDISVITTDRIVFSSGVTSANTVSDLSESKFVMGALSDANIYGYFIGGYTGSNVIVSTSDRIIFSTGVTSVDTTSILPLATASLIGLSDGSMYGYLAGGVTPSTVSTAYRIIFSSGVIGTNTVSNLSNARYLLSSSSDGMTYGYFAGGIQGTSTYVDYTDKINFSTGATGANTVSNLSQGRGGVAGLSDCAV
jgi:hypothetical protein